jgi:hypothetical protein
MKYTENLVGENSSNAVTCGCRSIEVSNIHVGLKEMNYDDWGWTEFVGSYILM